MMAQQDKTAVLSVSDKIAKGKELKELGNAEYKSAGTDSKKLTLAIRHYYNAIAYFSGLDNAQFQALMPGQKSAPLSDAVKADVEKNIIACYNNMAACQVKLERWERVIVNSDQVLKKSPSNAKALFRRGQAHLAMNDLTKAENDLQKAAELEPTDSGIKAELSKLKKRNQEYELKQKKEWAGMFDRK
ncbi:hypothetical protein HDU78_008466 [Chytriomyces hyalinus]|nr:hypothetical protein HDU78_008466 [Chytriomyces hyalinus]KAJ3259916.1 hypothetical protein HDU77_001575 [Chytriomyces hyalinus]